MKKIKFSSIIIMLIIATVVFIGCRDKRNPAPSYMPDMAFSRAYDPYSGNNLKQNGINYTGHPVEGTVRRGDLFAYTIPNDSNGYKSSVSIKNPLEPFDSTLMPEAKRLYNINCAICHGENLDAQGPLAGKVGGIANLTVAQYVNQPVGQMFHVVTYGKGNMGSYAAQLDRKQRWMVVQYVKSQQLKGGAASGTAPAATDSAATAKK